MLKWDVDLPTNPWISNGVVCVTCV